MKNANEVRPGEDDSQLEGELSGVCANWEFTILNGRGIRISSEFRWITANI